MMQHWPIPVAAGMIATAAVLGLWQHERADEAALPHGPRTRPVLARPAEASAAVPVSAPQPAAPAAPAKVSAPAGLKQQPAPHKRHIAPGEEKF